MSRHDARTSRGGGRALALGLFIAACRPSAPTLPPRFTFRTACAAIDQDLAGTGFTCLNLTGDARVGVWGTRARPDANTIESCFGATTAGEGLPAGLLEQRPAGALNLHYDDSSHAQVSAGLSLATIAKWLPDLNVTVDAESELAIEIAFEDRQVLALHDLDRHLSRALAQNAPETDAFQNAQRCRAHLCAGDQVLAVRALLARPRVTLREAARRRIGTTAGWTTPARLGFNLDVTRADHGEVSLTAEQPVVIAAQLIAGTEALGAAVCRP